MIGRVLIVDDDATIRRFLAATVGRAGYHVTLAEDAVPAMALSDTFDVVIADFNMLTGTGADVVRHFKGRCGDRVFCVVLSGDTDEITEAACRAAGADVVLSKPASPADLRRCLAAGLSSICDAA